MRKVIDKIGFETLFGGLFGLIAIIAIICEMAVAGFDAASIAGGIKDIASTIVIVMVFAIAIKNFIKNQPKKLVDKLNAAVAEWGNNNCPLIFKTTDFAPVDTYEQGFTILREPKQFLDFPELQYNVENETVAKYASQKSKNTGKFIDMPSYQAMVSGRFNIKLNFIQSHFAERADGFKDVAQSINLRFSAVGIEAQKPTDKAQQFVISVPQITNDDDINQFVDLLDFILTLLKIIA